MPEDKQLKFLMQSQGLNPSSLASTYILTVLPYDNTVRVCPWSLIDAMDPGKKVGLRGTELAAKGLRSLDSQGTAFCHVMGGNLLPLISVPAPHLADTSALSYLLSLLICQVEIRDFSIKSLSKALVSKDASHCTNE